MARLTRSVTRARSRRCRAAGGGSILLVLLSLGPLLSLGLLLSPGDGRAERDAPASSPLASEAHESLLAAALAPLLLSPEDLGFRHDYEPADPFRLPLVEQLLLNPRRAPAVVDSLSRQLVRGPGEWLGGVVGAGGRALGEMATPIKPVTGRPAEVPANLVERLVADFAAAPWDSSFAAAFAALTPGQIEELLALGSEIMSLEEAPDDLSIDDMAAESARAREESLAFLELGSAVERPALGAAWAEVARYLDTLVLYATELDWSEWSDERLAGGDDGAAPATGDLIGWRRLPDGRVAALGGPGATRYHAPCALIIDLGGDDQYLAGAGGNAGRPGAVSIVLDFAGDDFYRGRVAYDLAAGALGAGAVIDLAGNDIYDAPDSGLGAGFCGLGLLLDVSGDDRYLGGVFTHGAGTIGIGLLRDLAGSDLYQGSTYCQGFGFVGGLGLLDDRAGADIYLCHPRYTDLLRDESTTLSLSQGFGYGLRPDASGGIGLIVDGAGNDRYVAEVFGQGGAYWYGIGGLVERAGNDHYDGFNYAQGSGVHIAVGVLIDQEGNDKYCSRGVSQGCGHDLALGYLLDLSGDDLYEAHGLSHGAGNANGCGILFDLAGEDRTTYRTSSNTLGYGNWRRHHGSIGLAVHLGGADRYIDDQARPGAMWQKGTHGLGIDAERETLLEIGALCELTAAAAIRFELDAGGRAELLAAPPAVEPPEMRPLEAPLELPATIPPAIAGMTVDRLFVRAASGEPRFADERQAARAELVRRGAAVVPALIERLGSRVARDRHALKDLFRTIGAPAVESLAAALGDADERRLRTAAWCLERMETTGAERELLEVLETHPIWRARAAVASALGRGGGRQAVGPLIAALADSVASVRRAAVFALGEQAARSRRAASGEEDLPVGGNIAWASRSELEAAIPLLLAALDDPSYAVRFSASRALGRLGPWAISEMLTALPGASTRRAGLLIDALGFGGDRRAVPLLGELVEGPPLLAARARVALARLGEASREPGGGDTAAALITGEAADRAAEILEGTR